jgi:hypothetical protein
MAEKEPKTRMENDTDATAGALIEKVKACQTLSTWNPNLYQNLLGFAQYSDVDGIKEQLAYWLPAYSNLVELLGPVLAQLSAAQGVISDPNMVQFGEAELSVIDALGMDVPEDLARLLAQARTALEEYNSGGPNGPWAGDLAERLKNLEDQISDWAHYSSLMRDELNAVREAAESVPTQPSRNPYQY